VDPDVGFLSAVAHKLAMDLVGAVRPDVPRETGCLDLAVAPRHTDRMCGPQGVLEVPPGRDARIFGERDVGRFMWTRLADPRPAGPWMFVGSKYSDTAGPLRRIVQRGAGCLDLGWLTVETERLVWAGADRGMFHVEPDGLVDTPQQRGRMFHVEQRRAAPGEPLSDRTADGPRFRGREVGAAPESGYHQG